MIIYYWYTYNSYYYYRNTHILILTSVVFCWHFCSQPQFKAWSTKAMCGSCWAFQSLSERSGADEIFLPIMLKMSVVIFCADVKHKNIKPLSAYDYHTKMFNVGASWPFSATLQLRSKNILMHLQYKPATLVYHHHFNTNTLSLVAVTRWCLDTVLHCPD